MENGIMVYALETCSKCQELRNGLDEENIQYQYINIDKNNELGDRLEGIYRCTSYPIVLINKVKPIILLSYTSLPITSNIKIYNSIAELIQMIKTIK